jgi:hypothetical protein
LLQFLKRFCKFIKAPMLNISQNIWSSITFRAQPGLRVGQVLSTLKTTKTKNYVYYSLYSTSAQSPRIP